MTNTMTIDQLTDEVQRQAENKLELYTPVRHVQLQVSQEGNPALLVQGKGAYPMTKTGFEQFVEYLKIPRDYAHRCALEHPGLLEDTAAAWLRSKGDDERLLRVLDGRVRAVCSPFYRILDHDKMLLVTRPILEHLGVDVTSCTLTDNVMSIAVTSPKFMAPVGQRKVGDIVQAGFRLFNSETRERGLRALYHLFRLACTNGMTVRDRSSGGGFGRSHRGRRLGFNISVPIEWQPGQDRKESDQKLWLEFGGQVLDLLNEERFAELIGVLNSIADIEVDGKPEEIMMALGMHLDMPKEEISQAQDRLGAYLTELGNTRWAYVNALTDLARDRTNPDRGIELETLGWEVATLGDRTWVALTESLN